MRQRITATILAGSTLSAAPASAAYIDVETGDPSLPAIVTISGPITDGDFARFKALTANIDEAYVILSSPGGLVNEGISIGAEIWLGSFATMVEPQGECYSICAIMWISGKHRIMAESSAIGAHAAWQRARHHDGTEYSTESGVANAEIGAYLTTIGFGVHTVRYFTTAGPDDLLWITPEVADRLNIPVTVTQGTQRSTTPAPQPALTPAPSGELPFAARTSAMMGFWQYECLPVMADYTPRFSAYLTELYDHLETQFAEAEMRNAMAPEVQRLNGDAQQNGLLMTCLHLHRTFRENNLPTGVEAPGFDCQRASTPAEQTICATPELWPADIAVSRLFPIMADRHTGKQHAQLNNMQRGWITSRDACGRDAGCIENNYNWWLSNYGEPTIHQ